MTLNYPLKINQGESWETIFPVVDSLNEPVNITGWSARAQVRHGPLEPVLYEWSAGNSNLTLSGSAVTLTVTPAVSSTWSFTEGSYDLELTDTLGRVYRIAEGSVKVKQEITR